jgi:hypothetical protein
MSGAAAATPPPPDEPRLNDACAPGTMNQTT